MLIHQQIQPLIQQKFIPTPYFFKNVILLQLDDFWIGCNNICEHSAANCGRGALQILAFSCSLKAAHTYRTISEDLALYEQLFLIHGHDKIPLMSTTNNNEETATRFVAKCT